MPIGRGRFTVARGRRPTGVSGVAGLPTGIATGTALPGLRVSPGFQSGLPAGGIAPSSPVAPAIAPAAIPALATPGLKVSPGFQSGLPAAGLPPLATPGLKVSPGYQSGLPALGLPGIASSTVAGVPRLASSMPKNGTVKGRWGDIGKMRVAESVAVGGFTGGTQGLQMPNTRRAGSGYTSVKKIHNPDRAHVNGGTVTKGKGK